MLIGACGAGGTGKTTTMKALAEATGLPFIPSASRAVFARRGIVEKDQNNMTAEQQWELQQEIFAAREELESTTTNGIADRTLFDQVAYNLLRAPTMIDEKTINDLINRATFVAARYDKIFYFPLVTFAGQDDGMRDSAYGQRFNFDSILKAVLFTSGLSVTSKLRHVPVVSVEKRVDWIKKNI